MKKLLTATAMLMLAATACHAAEIDYVPRIGETTAEYNARTSGNTEELARLQAKRRAEQEEEDYQARYEQRQRDLRRNLQTIQQNFDDNMQRIDKNYNQAIGRINGQARREQQYRCQRYVESGRANEQTYQHYCK